MQQRQLGEAGFLLSSSGKHRLGLFSRVERVLWKQEQPEKTVVNPTGTGKRVSAVFKKSLLPWVGH